MFKKIVMVSSILAIVPAAYAVTNGAYVGASVGTNYALFKNQVDEGSFHSGGLGSSADIFAGYGKIVRQNIYLGGEVSATGYSSNVEAFNFGHGAFKNSYETQYSYGASILPGILLTDNTLAYARLGVVKSGFEVKSDNIFSVPSHYHSTRTSVGAQAGLGVQTGLTKNVDVRGEYDVISYRSFTVNGTKTLPSSGQAKLALVYKFE